jgi:choline dehydrogenase
MILSLSGQVPLEVSSPPVWRNICRNQKYCCWKRVARFLPGIIASGILREWALVREGSQYEWGYVSVKQNQLHGREIPMSRARGLGGCGLHNAMVYVRGGKSGYDDWERIGCTGWNYENVLPFFKRLESKVGITTAAMNEFSNAVSASCQNHDIPFREDYNLTGDEPCVSPFQYLIKHGRRETAYSAYLKEVPENIKCLRVVLSLKFS